MNKINWHKLPTEEKANVLTHGFGILAGLALTPFLIYRATGIPLQLFGVLIFSLSLLAVYTSSTIYHSVQSERMKFAWRKIDHISIYFLIAGTHTPFLLLFLNNSTGIIYLWILWGLVLLGILYKLFFFDRWEWLSLVLYLGMGWMAAFTLPLMLKVIPMASFNWIIVGGICYTLGVFFYAFKRIPYNHAIWHLFVLGGSSGHYVAVWMAL
ncbi:MAG: hemolysin III family protein [Saprospiraceae bacterium]